MATDRIVGIDLGTTNSLVAFMQGESPVVIPGDDGSNLVPSVVALDSNNQAVVGNAARELCKNVGGGRCDEEQICPLSDGDVLNGAFEIGFASGFGEEVGDYFLTGQGSEGQRCDEFAGAASHDYLDGEAILLQAAH